MARSLGPSPDHTSVKRVDADENAAGASGPSLVGRAPELALLYGLVDGVHERGGAIVLRGEAGIGKTALINAACARARESGLTVAETTGAQAEALLGFAGLHQLLQRFLDHTKTLPKPQRRALETAFGIAAGDAPDLFLIGLATLGLVAEAAVESPLLLVVDDAQWLDSPSSHVLSFVGRRLRNEPVILLFARREGIPSAVEDTELPELRVGGLPGDAALVLVREMGAGIGPELQRRIVDEASGNPLALIEFSRARDITEASFSGPLPLTARLERTFAAKLPALNLKTRALVLLAALYEGAPRDLEYAAAELLGESVEADAWEPAVAAELGSLTSTSFVFRHPLVRSAVQQTATSEERRRAHASLALALAGDEDRAVWHRAAAAEGCDDEVAAALVQAAERARHRGASDVAVAALERAAGLTADPSLCAARLFQAGQLACVLGRGPVSRRLLRAARRLKLGSLEEAHAAFLLEALEGTWSGDAAVRGVARAASELIDAGEDRRALDALQAISLRLYWSNLDSETRRSIAAIVERAAVPADDPIRLAVLAHVDPVHAGAAVIRQLARLTPDELGDPEAMLEVGNAAIAVWAHELALPFLRVAGEQLQADGRLLQQTIAVVSQAWAELQRGNIRETLIAASEGAALAHETGQVRFMATAKLAHAVAASELGDDGVADKLIAEAESVILPMGANPLLSLVALARGRQALAGERFAEGYSHLRRIFDPDDTAYQPFVQGLVLADLTDAALHGDGELDVLHTHLAEWEQIAGRTQAPHLRDQLAYAAALTADASDVDERFELAIRKIGSPLYRARVEMAYGAWLRRHRRLAESRDPLRRAAHVFDALGLVRLAERARRELRASGEIARHRVPEAWAQLTPQERQIAQLAAEGLSNREIGKRLYLSHRTVGSHLYKLFPKLGIISRAQLQAALEATPDV